MQKINTYFKKVYNNRIFQHIFGITLFISYEWIVQLKGNTNANVLALTLFYCFDIIIFYSFGNLVLPMLSKQSYPVILKAICAALIVGVFSMLHLQYTRMMYWLYEQPFARQELHAFIKLSVTRVVYIGTGAFIYWHIRYSFRQKISYYEVVEKKDKLEIALLRAQLNPHLLFNVLSAVQNTLTGKYPETKLLMNALTDIFALAMKGSDPDSEPTLKDELTLVERIVFLHEELGKNCDLEFEVSADAESLRFPPKLLATLVENIFKHGDFSAGKPMARIRIVCHEDVLQFKSQNARITNSDTTGNRIGLSNSRERLNRSFPDRYFLHFDTDNTDTFTLDLTIKLK